MAAARRSVGDLGYEGICFCLRCPALACGSKVGRAEGVEPFGGCCCVGPCRRKPARPLKMRAPPPHVGAAFCISSFSSSFCASCFLLGAIFRAVGLAASQRRISLTCHVRILLDSRRPGGKPSSSIIL